MNRGMFKGLIYVLIDNADGNQRITIKMLDGTEIIIYAEEDTVVMGDIGFGIYAGDNDDGIIRAVSKYKNVDAVY